MNEQHKNNQRLGETPVKYFSVGPHRESMIMR